MRKTTLSLAVLALAAVPAFAGKYNSTINVGEKAPAISGIPAVMGDKETTIDLAKMKEDVVVVVFLANHCPMVTTYEDRIVDLAKSFEGKSVKVVGISVSKQAEDDLDAIKVRVKERGYNYVYGSDVSQAVGKAYGAARTPEFFVLDKDRVVRYTGALDDNTKEEKVKKTYVKDAVDAILKGETVEVTESRPVGCGIGYSK